MSIRGVGAGLKGEPQERTVWPPFTVLLHADHNDALFVDIGWPAAIENGDTVLRFLRFNGPDCYSGLMCPSEEGLAKFRPIGWTHWNLQTFEA